tara:strand:- start:4747 stop:4977 length:231 start_codon:yes stop_codon:yes gene_type:complete
MYINGRKVTLDDLKKLADKLIGSLINDLYKTLKSDGIDKAIPGTKKEQKALLHKMLQHYIELEEYEKCAYIRDQIK